MHYEDPPVTRQQYVIGSTGSTVPTGAPPLGGQVPGVKFVMVAFLPHRGGAETSAIGKHTGSDDADVIVTELTSSVHLSSE